MLVRLFADKGGFAYDPCSAWGSPGDRPMGCDEFFPEPVIYKDLRGTVSSGCKPTQVMTLVRLSVASVGSDDTFAP